MPRKGWIKLHHSLLDNPIWEAKPFDEGRAWVDLLLMAENEEKDFLINGTVIHQVPGGVYHSKQELMKRWGWTKYKLKKTLDRWESLGMIKIQQHRIQPRNQQRTYTEITVEKWRFFQGRPPKNSHENSTENRSHLKKNTAGGDGEGLSPRPAAPKMLRRWVDDHWEVTPIAD